jgi:lipopolysaccharide export system permease protein
MKRLASYIFKLLTETFLFGVIAFTSIFSGVGVIPNLVREASNYGIPFFVAMSLFIARLPQVMVYTFPMAILLSSLQVFSNLSNNNEVTALRSAGIGLVRIVMPAIFFGLAVSLLTMFFSESLVPKANLYAEYTVAKAKNEFRPMIRNSVNIPQYENGQLKRKVNAGRMYKDIMEDVTVTEYNNGYLERVVFAETADFIPSQGWVFNEGILYMFNKEADTLTRILFEKELINLKVSPTDINVILEKTHSDQLSFNQLKRQIEKKELTGQNTLKMRVELYVKTSLPFACLIFMLLGAPLGLNPQRRSNAVGIGLSLVIVMFYYMLMALGEWLGIINVLRPIVAAWLPNIIVGVLGLFLLLQKAKQ